MKKRVGAAYFLVPVLYLAVIVGLLVLQFSGGQRFQESIGSLSVSGATQPGGSGEAPRLTRIQVEYSGITFPFDQDSRLLLEHENESRTELSVSGYDQVENGFVIRFNQGVSLRFLSNGEEARELQVQPVVPTELLPLAGVHVPFYLTGDAEQRPTETPGVLAVDTGTDTFYLAPPPRSDINADGGTLTLPGDVSEQTVRYTHVSDSDQQIVDRWFRDNQAAIPDEEYNATINEFVDAAYEGWSDSRYNGGSGTWDMRSGSARFEERILVAYLTEAWARDSYTVAINDMRRAADLHQPEVGLAAATFLGNLRETTTRVRSEDQERTSELLTLARNENHELFLTPDLVQFAADRGSEELLDAVLSFAGRANYRVADMVTAIGMLRTYVEAGNVSDQIQQRLSPLRAIVEERVLPALARIDEGFFVRTGPGQVDLYNSILAGSLLATIAADEGEPLLQRVGRNLISTALSYADQNGFLPRVFFTGNGTLQGTQGVLGPEAIYHLITDRASYPSQRSLYASLGQGSWVWSAVSLTQVEVTDQTYRFEIDNPPNRTHFLIMQGIPPFEGMDLFGQRWRNDPSFESYIKGRHYNSDTQTLLIKYTDPDPNGAIVLDY